MDCYDKKSYENFEPIGSVRVIHVSPAFLVDISLYRGRRGELRRTKEEPMLGLGKFMIAENGCEGMTEPSDQC